MYIVTGTYSEPGNRCYNVLVSRELKKFDEFGAIPSVRVTDLSLELAIL
jgi:hypothetical protein